MGRYDDGIYHEVAEVSGGGEDKTTISHRGHRGHRDGRKATTIFTTKTRRHKGATKQRYNDAGYV